MEYSEELRGRILRTIGVDPTTISPGYVRQMLATLEEEVKEMVFGHIGHERTTEDVVITYAEINSLVRVREVQNEFMEVYEEFLDNQ